MRFSLDVPVEKRVLKAPGPVSFTLDFPALYGEGLAEWRARSAVLIAGHHRARVPGPVTLSLSFESRPGRGDLSRLAAPLVGLLVERGLIDGDHRTVLREIRAGWGRGRGVWITIEPWAPSAISAEGLR
ncbi:MAG: hypothetical protein ACREFW_04840 [Rhizomicrobium sp.]